MSRRSRKEAERSRLEEALVDEVVERGFSSASIEGVCERAELDRAVFRHHFTGVEDGYCSLLEARGAEMYAATLRAFQRESCWRDQIRAVAQAMFQYIDEDRRRGHFLFIDVFDAGERAQRIRDQYTDAFEEFIDLGRQELEEPDSLSRATAVAIGGAVYDQIRAAIALDSDASDLLPKLMYSVVLPYVGPSAAAEELNRRPVTARAGVDAGAVR